MSRDQLSNKSNRLKKSTTSRISLSPIGSSAKPSNQFGSELENNLNHMLEMMAKNGGSIPETAASRQKLVQEFMAKHPQKDKPNSSSLVSKGSSSPVKSHLQKGLTKVDALMDQRIDDAQSICRDSIRLSAVDETNMPKITVDALT